LQQGFGPEENTWYFPRVCGTFKERAGFHGCQMPEQLLGRIIRSCSHEGEIVLDPFSGSATTLAVAKKLYRKHVGFDLSPDYVEQGTQRLGVIRIGDALDGATEPTMSAPKTPDKRNTARNGARKPKSKPSQSPLETVLANAAQAQKEWSSESFAAGLIEAFQQVNEGFSLDRVIADPDLNTALANSCKALSLPGDIRFWNRKLFRLRKAGKLSNIPTDRRTDLTWEDCDSFLFASEIAWKQMLGQKHLGQVHRSLDEILCDPDLAAEFDKKAIALAPGFKPWQYRWGALKLRKESKRTRARAGLLQKKPRSFKEPFCNSINALAKYLARAPVNPGVYLVIDSEDQKPLYAGESLNLRVRLTRQFDKEALRAFWKKPASELSVQYFTTDADISLLLAYQSLCVSKRRPMFNVIDPSLT
jgi:site-specific DNA-methyltransferase (adenine-specific)